jgi:hypothetical protein
MFNKKDAFFGKNNFEIMFTLNYVGTVFCFQCFSFQSVSFKVKPRMSLPVATSLSMV